MPKHLLLFTAGQVPAHDYPGAARALAAVLEPYGYALTHATSADALLNLSPEKYPAVLLYTDGTVLASSHVEALSAYVRAGGGLLAIHSALTSNPHLDAYAKLLGVRPAGPGVVINYPVAVTDPDHPVAHRLQPFRLDDELYVFDKTADLRPFLVTWHHGRPEPVAFSRTEGAGRVVGLAPGHHAATFSHPVFLSLVVRSARYAAGEDWSNKTIKCAAIGYGGAFNMGKLHLQGCERARMTPTAVCDVDPHRTATAQQELGNHVQTYTRVEDLLEKSDAELCIIITPHNTHAPLSIQCLRGGRNVVTEKPYTVTVEEATEVIETARRAQKMATVFHNRRWDGDFLAIRNAVESGLIGDVFHVECFFGGFNEPKPDWWRASKAVSGGAFYDWGAHFVDWVLQILPHRIESVSGSFHKRRWHQVTNEDHCEAYVRFAGGRTAYIQQSSLAAIPKSRWRILGTHGAIEQKHHDEKEGLRLVTYQDGVRHDGTIPYLKSDWDGFYRNVADHLILGEPLSVTPESARNVIAVLSLAERSSQQGGLPIPLPFEH